MIKLMAFILESHSLYVYLMKINHSLINTVPTGHPQNIVAMATTSTSILLAWEPPFIHERNGIITHYAITLISGENTSSYTTDAEMLALEMLRPFTSYMVYIAAFTAVGLGPFTPARTITTPEDGNFLMS